MCEMYGKDSLDRFGDDLCEELLSYLSLEDKFRFECISKQWRRVVYKRQMEIIGHKWKTLSEDNWRIFETIVKKCTNISSIHLPLRCRPKDTAIDLMIKHCSQLTDIHINFWDISCETIDKFITKFGPQLKSIKVLSFNESVDKKSIDKWLEMCVNLETTNVCSESIPNLSLQSVTEMLIPFKRLNSIELYIHIYGDPLGTVLEALDAFADKYGHQMKTIVLTVGYETELIMDQILTKLHILPQMQALISLRLIFMCDSTSEDLIPLLAKIGINCRQMKSLYIEVNEWTPETIHTISEHFMALKRLTIEGTHFTGEPLTSHSLAPLKRLTHLYLSSKYNECLQSVYITDTFFVNIANNLPKVQYLDVKYVNISDESLISLSGLTQIRGITLTGNVRNWEKSLSEMCVNNVITNCPKIAFIRFKTSR